MKTPLPAELESLLNALADETIDEAGEQALAAWLKRDADARGHYRDFMGLHAGLHWDYVQSATPAREAVAQKPAPSWWRWPLAAAAMLAVLFGVAKLLSPHDAEPVNATVALLARSVGADWVEGAWQPGQSLAPGWLRLRAGAVQIEFSRGTRVLLEGPAEFQLVSDNAGYLRRGKLRATVPQSAHGFTIRGVDFYVVDRGTEFGCLVPESGAAEVHVLAGKVEVEGNGSAARMLATAEAVRVSAGRLEAMPARTELFLSDEEFARAAAGDAGSRLAAWRKTSAALSAHPAALVHYDFEQVRGPARTLPNLVPGRDVPASIVGCEAAQGRWPGKGALDFKRADDRLRFTVSGEFQSLTLLAWVRVDGLPNIQSSLLMGESELPGEVHWYLNKGGGVGFAVIGPDGQWHGTATPGLFRRDTFGTWVFLAVTFDGPTGTATHYFNGQPVASQPLGQVGSLRLGTVEIANWGLRPGATLRASRKVLKETAGYVRNLQGRMDEFALLSAALSAEEIQRLYQTGRPTPDTPPAVPR